MATPNHILILDNGAASIKSGLSTQDAPHIIPNCKMKVKSERQRQYIGDQIEDCKDCSGLFYILPHQKGFIINWDTQREIWEYLFTQKYKDAPPKDTDLILTEPYFNFKSLQNNTDEILFEEYGFNSILRTNTGFLSAINYKSNNCKKQPGSDTTTTPASTNGGQLSGEDDTLPLACLVVDSGFSFTHIAPYVYKETSGYVKLKSGVRRIDVGGKALTNLLKEIISYRQMNVMDETYVINQCKEDICMVATDFEESLKKCEQNRQNKIARDYILPDFTNVKRGYVQKPNWRASNRMDPNSTEPQFVRLANERFQVPEILFHPSDIGLNQVGIVEAIVDSIQSLPKELHSILYNNIILTGGNANLPGYKERVLKGVRSYCPFDYTVRVFLPDDPITHAWYGGLTLAHQQELLKPLMITKKEYDESGENKKQICVDKFDT